MRVKGAYDVLSNTGKVGCNVSKNTLEPTLMAASSMLWPPAEKRLLYDVAHGYKSPEARKEDDNIFHSQKRETETLSKYELWIEWANGLFQGKLDKVA